MQTHVHGDARSPETAEQNNHERHARRATQRRQVTQGIPPAHPARLTLDSLSPSQQPTTE